MSIGSDRPPSDVIEVSIFGRGFGEAIVVHVGDDKWVVVDCFFDGDDPIPLKYLRTIGSDPSECIKLLVATHWHADHVRGISTVLRQAPLEAKTVFPMVLSGDEFAAYLDSAAYVKAGSFGNAVDDFQDLLEVLNQRGQPGIGATVSKHVLQIGSTQISHGSQIDVIALSPSDAEAYAFLREVAVRLQQTESGLRAMPFDKNDVSAALWIRIGAQNILLGADVEISDDPQRGWHSIIGSRSHSSDRATVFKIPHHGSVNGYEQKVWLDLLADNPIAGLTTWSAGSKLPKREGIERITQHTNRAYVTTQSSAKAKKRPAAVTSTLDQKKQSVTSIKSSVGQIRFRKRIGAPDDWQISVFGPAHHISQHRPPRSK